VQLAPNSVSEHSYSGFQRGFFPEKSAHSSPPLFNCTDRKFGYVQNKKLLRLGHGTLSFRAEMTGFLSFPIRNPLFVLYSEKFVHSPEAGIRLRTIENRLNYILRRKQNNDESEIDKKIYLDRHGGLLLCSAEPAFCRPVVCRRTEDADIQGDRSPGIS